MNSHVTTSDDRSYIRRADSGLKLGPVCVQIFSPLGLVNEMKNYSLPWWRIAHEAWRDAIRKEREKEKAT